MRTAYLILGAIGSGKSAIANVLLTGQRLQGVEYIGSDLYKKKYFNSGSSVDNRAYRAADDLVVDRITRLCIDGTDFAYEFCPTNRSKVAAITRMLTKHHYHCISIFVGTNDASINLARCQFREARGADPVAGEKIANRHREAWRHLIPIIDVSAVMYFIDNSAECPKVVAVLTAKTLEVWDTKCSWLNSLQLLLNRS